jgi:hypothetical protein
MKSITQLKQEKSREIYCTAITGREVEFDGLYFRKEGLGRFIKVFDDRNNLITEVVDSDDIAGLLHSDHFIW